MMSITVPFNICRVVVTQGAVRGINDINTMKSVLLKAKQPHLKDSNIF